MNTSHQNAFRIVPIQGLKQRQGALLSLPNTNMTRRA